MYNNGRKHYRVYIAWQRWHRSLLNSYSRSLPTQPVNRLLTVFYGMKKTGGRRQPRVAWKGKNPTPLGSLRSSHFIFLTSLGACSQTVPILPYYPVGLSQLCSATFEQLFRVLATSTKFYLSEQRLRKIQVQSTYQARKKSTISYKTSIQFMRMS